MNTITKPFATLSDAAAYSAARLADKQLAEFRLTSADRTIAIPGGFAALVRPNFMDRDESVYHGAVGAARRCQIA